MAEYTAESELASLPYPVVFASRLPELLNGIDPNVTGMFTQLLDNTELG
jgi:hypothetical protein